MAIDRELNEAERELVGENVRTSSWDAPNHPYHNRDLDKLVNMYAPDAISIPANHRAMRGHEEIRTWYARRTGDYDMNIVSEVNSVDIVGDVALMTGIFRVTRSAEAGVAGLDHGGCWLSVMKKIDGRWRMWRDMDTPSPDADVFYDRLPRGW
jgi:ketosteroid isomerase-like protein